jgi:hypothetical protein
MSAWRKLAWLRLPIPDYIRNIARPAVDVRSIPHTLPPPACAAAPAPWSSRDVAISFTKALEVSCFVLQELEFVWIGAIFDSGQATQPEVLDAVACLRVASLSTFLQLGTLFARKFSLPCYCSCPILHTSATVF